MTYYRLYDTQTGRYMTTGYNATSQEDLCEQYASYKSVDWNNYYDDDMNKIWPTLTLEQKIAEIKADQFEIEESDKPFPEQSIAD